MASVRTYVGRAGRAGWLPDVDYLLNHVVNRIPWASPRLSAYQAWGVSFDAIRSSNIALGVQVWNGAGLSIGRGSAISPYCYLDARGGVRIDDHSTLAREVTILTATHVVNDPDFGARTAPVHVGSRAFVGVRALVLPGVRIGDGAVVGAGAVVTRDVAPYTVVAGNPARPVGQRNQPMTYELSWRPSWH